MLVSTGCQSNTGLIPNLPHLLLLFLLNCHCIYGWAHPVLHPCFHFSIFFWLALCLNALAVLSLLASTFVMLFCTGYQPNTGLIQNFSCLLLFLWTAPQYMPEHILFYALAYTFGLFVAAVTTQGLQCYAPTNKKLFGAHTFRSSSGITFLSDFSLPLCLSSVGWKHTAPQRFRLVSTPTPPPPPFLFAAGSCLFLSCLYSCLFIHECDAVRYGYFQYSAVWQLIIVTFFACCCCCSSQASFLFVRAISYIC